jgi:hypothetical protein
VLEWLAHETSTRRRGECFARLEHRWSGHHNSVSGDGSQQPEDKSPCGPWNRPPGPRFPCPPSPALHPLRAPHMTSMPFDAPIYQNPFHNASSNVVAASLDNPNPPQQQPSDSPSYFDLARLDGQSLDDSYAVYLALTHSGSTTAPNDVFLYTSSQATTTTPPVQTISPTEIHSHSPFCLCGSPGVLVVEPPSSTLCGSAPIPQTALSSSAYVQQQVQSTLFLPSFPTPNGTLAATRRSYSPPISPERRHSLPSPRRPVLYHSDPFHRRSSWVAPPSASMNIEGYLQYPFPRTASFGSECESPYSIGPVSLSSVSYG